MKTIHTNGNLDILLTYRDVITLFENRLIGEIIDSELNIYPRNVSMLIIENSRQSKPIDQDRIESYREGKGLILRIYDLELINNVNYNEKSLISGRYDGRNIATLYSPLNLSFELKDWFFPRKKRSYLRAFG